MCDSVLQFETRYACLTVGTDGIVRSLVMKSTGEELLETDEKLPLFTVTQPRPYNNEVKLAHPNKRTTFDARSIERDGDCLLVCFETVPVQVRIRVTEHPDYLAFAVEGFDVRENGYLGLHITPPVVDTVCLCQLPVKHRKNFGEWLNVCWDETAAVNLLAAAPEVLVDSQKRSRCRVLSAEVRRDIKMEGVSAVLAVCPPDSLLDCIDRVERDFGLPLGAQSRRSPNLNRSMYFISSLSPETLEEHLRYAKAGGFSHILMYYTCFFKEEGYYYCGDYDYLPCYPNGASDVAEMLRKIKAAGFTPGLHVLQTHIGMKSRYVTPRADPRLHLTEHFTLSQPLSEQSEEPFTLYVQENPFGVNLADRTRILKFGTELISFEGISTERPYAFLGCRRGDWKTTAVAHPAGEIGGLLDVSEYGGYSCYIDQRTDLQDEVAEKIAAAYNLGFRFMYFDGSEGAIPPFEYYVPLAQYRVLSRYTQPLEFAEGAARAHFSWHFMSGGNAFDIFPPDVFKQKIVEFPMTEAPQMRCDLTRINFGWWEYQLGTQPDLYEFGTSRAAGWDCPVTVQSNLQIQNEHPRTADIFEVMRRWEEVRRTGWLTDAQKQELRSPDTEHILLVNEQGEFELFPYFSLPTAAHSNPHLRAFTFERHGESWAVYWHTDGEGTLNLPLSHDSVELYDALDRPSLPVGGGNSVSLPASGRRYIRTRLPMDDLRHALENAELA